MNDLLHLHRAGAFYKNNISRPEEGANGVRCRFGIIKVMDLIVSEARAGSFRDLFRRFSNRHQHSDLVLSDDFANRTVCSGALVPLVITNNNIEAGGLE